MSCSLLTTSVSCNRTNRLAFMFLSYAHSVHLKDITTSLQHKQDEIARMRRKTTLESKQSHSDSPDLNGIERGDVSEEPHPTLPLWRRVTKQFWWNEHMQQPLIDAGVSGSATVRFALLTKRTASFLYSSSHAGVLSNIFVWNTKTARVLGNW